MEEAACCSTSSGTSASKKEQQMARLRDLHLRRNEARKLNHQEVVDEDHRKKLPSNFEARQRRIEWEEEQERIKKECAERGEDYDIVKLRDVGADEVERLERKKRKKNPDQGFADFEQATFRQYQRLTKQHKPDMQEYNREKDKMGEEVFYPTSDTLGVTEHKDTETGVNRMVEDLEKQIAKRAKYSRRRAFDEDEDIDYINERNMKFNKKLERFYGKYTAGIKQDLERGTAI
jgi:pre-mRNA-splicing factor SYF2